MSQFRTIEEVDTLKQASSFSFNQSISTSGEKKKRADVSEKK